MTEAVHRKGRKQNATENKRANTNNYDNDARTKEQNPVSSQLRHRRNVER
jgi:hypothetical protein